MRIRSDVSGYLECGSSDLRHYLRPSSRGQNFFPTQGPDPCSRIGRLYGRLCGSDRMYLDTLNAGLVTSATIFAPRRVGKTSFLLKDLTPAAESAGYTVAYADPIGCIWIP